MKTRTTSIAYAVSDDEFLGENETAIFIENVNGDGQGFNPDDSRLNEYLTNEQITAVLRGEVIPVPNYEVDYIGGPHRHELTENLYE